MRKIVGFKLKNVPVEKVEMPVGARIIQAMDVNGEPTVFADIDGDQKLTELRTVYRVVTGKPVDPAVLGKVYIGSFLIANYGIVYHFYTGDEHLPQEIATVIPVAKEGPPEHPFGA